MVDKTDNNKAEKIVDSMRKLVDASRKERASWYKLIDKWWGYYINDPKIIFGTHAFDDVEKRDAANPSQIHVPIVSEYVDSRCSVMNGSDMELRYVPKLDQDELDEQWNQMSRMGNAALEAYRGIMGWNATMHRMVKSVEIFDKYYIGIGLDYVQQFPRPVVKLIDYNPWQVYHTPGVRFDQARDFVVVTWVNKEELKAQFPDIVDEIDKLETANDIESDRENNGISTGIINVLKGVPGLNGETIKAPGDSVQVLERWQFNATLATYPETEDNQVIRQEAAQIDSVARGESPIDESGRLMFDVKQYHSNHRLAHIEQYKAYSEALAAQTIERGMDQYGIVHETMVPVVANDGERGMVEMAMQVLDAHITMHEQAFEDLGDTDEERFVREGKYPKYDGGWRQTTVLGEEIVAFDGASKFYTEYGISGVPFVELEGEGHPSCNFANSRVDKIIPLNKIVDGFLNSAIDNAKLFGNHKWWYDQKFKADVEAGEAYMNNDPRVPDVLPEGAMFGTNCGIIDAKEIPGSTMNFINLGLSLAGRAAAVSPAIQGLGQTGVRSAAQNQQHIVSSSSQLTYDMTRMKPALERIGYMAFKMFMMVPPEDHFVKPIIDGKMVAIDHEMLRNTEFAIEVVVNPGGTAAGEDRYGLMLGMLQNAMQHPAFQDPVSLAELYILMSKAVMSTMPDMATAFQNLAQRLQQGAQQQQAQMQQGQGLNQQAQNSPNQMTG